MKYIASKSVTQEILQKYNIVAKKKYGQNFIIDPNIIHNIVKSANIDKDTCVIEIGPGIGALTQIISMSAKKVLCYEIDERFFSVYETYLNANNIEFQCCDFLSIDIYKVIEQCKAQYQKVIVVANLPYYITTAIIEKIILSNSNIDAMVIMVQKEFALKMTGQHRNPLSIILESMSDVSYEFTVPKQVFLPAPHVDSAIIKIQKRKDVDLKLYQLVKTAFTQRRKTIFNNLKTVYPNIEEMLEKCQIEKHKRSEQLELIDFLRLTEQIS